MKDKSLEQQYDIIIQEQIRKRIDNYNSKMTDDSYPIFQVQENLKELNFEKIYESNIS